MKRTRLGVLTTAVLAVLTILGASRVGAEEQKGWRWCSKCQGLFFSLNASPGACPVDRASHDGRMSGEYAVDLPPTSASGQNNWRWCSKCQGMFFNGNPSKGVCPADSGPHNGGSSGDYRLRFETAPLPLHTQSLWRWCQKCQGLFFHGNPSKGRCPADGNPHDGHLSGKYLVKVAHPFAAARPSRLLVVAPRAFAAALQPLIDHKNKTGMSACLITREALTGYFTGRDDPERIKWGINYAFRTLGTTYVMLVGDASQIPARFRYIQLMPSDPNFQYIDGTYNPADLYYADMVGATSIVDTWDLDGDGKYNEQHWTQDASSYNPDRVDGFPDVAVGRVPAHTAADVTHYVNKVIRYETGQMSPWLSGISFFFDRKYEGSLAMCRQVQTDSGISAVIASDSVRYVGVNYASGDPLPSGTLFGNLGSVTNALIHSFWATYLGHGYNLGWGVTLQGESQSYNCDDQLVRSLWNKYALPIVYSASCETGQFALCAPFGEYQDQAGKRRWLWWNHPNTQGHRVRDIVTGQFWDGQATVPAPNAYDFGDASNRTFSYAWLCAPNEGGAIAYFGEVLVAPNNFGRDLEARILKQYATGSRILGDLWLGGQRQSWTDFKSSQDVLGAPRIYLGIMTLFGDPSLRLR